MVHKPKHKVHSFRNLIGGTAASNPQQEIELERQNMNVAFRIVKFQLMPNDVSSASESSVQIFREEQTAGTAPFTSGDIDFSNPDLLGAAFFSMHTAADIYSEDLSVIFDNMLFSRNIFITHHNNDDGVSINWYIEIEEVPVSGSALMQLKLGVARRLNLEQ